MIFETYQLEINDTQNNKCSISLNPKDNSKIEALEKKGRKIYIVCDGETVLYIGEANTSIKTRFQRSSTSYNYFKANNIARGGYKGYKWLDPENNPSRRLTLHVVVFNNDYDEKRKEIEAIEGELVYEVRSRTGNWPTWQNEIHFSNVDGASQKAKTIIDAFGLN
jgi:hypothetical protein